MPNRITRRAFNASAAAFLPLAHAADSQLEVRVAEPGPDITPMLYGHFIEHLGGVIYDGVWVGRASKIPNVDGIRKAFIDDLKRIKAPVLRWPGGCFADSYHWRDGIGGRRPKTYNFWQRSMPKGVDATEPNTFGTHEFLKLCELVGAEPYLAGNVNSGTPQEFADWVSYCNAPQGTLTLAAERAANGHTAPYNVRYWGVGNESWGCGGNFKPEEYAAAYARFVAQFPTYTAPYLIAAGPSSGDLNWTRGFFEAFTRKTPQGVRQRAPMHGWALHYYTFYRPPGGRSDKFPPEQWYPVLALGMRIEKLIQDHWAAMGEYDPQHRVKLVIDEWGVWYRDDAVVKPSYLFSHYITLRDAVHTALNFDIFHRHADKIAMTNVAQTVNCIHSLFRADGPKFVRTPAYYVYELYLPHMGARSLPVQSQAAGISFTGQGGEAAIPGLSASASLHGRTVTVTLTNPSHSSPQQVSVRLASGSPRGARAKMLTHPDMQAANTFEAPDEVRIQPLNATVSGDRVLVSLPKHAIAALQIELA